MSYLIDEFCKLVITNSNMKIQKIYNYFIQTRSDEEAEWMSTHFMLFVKTGEACRQAPTDLKDEIIRLL